MYERLGHQYEHQPCLMFPSKVVLSTTVVHRHRGIYAALTVLEALSPALHYDRAYLTRGGGEEKTMVRVDNAVLKVYLHRTPHFYVSQQASVDHVWSSVYRF